MKNFLDRLAKNEPYRSSVKSVKKYLLGICLIIALIVLSVFWGFHLRTNALFERQMVNSSRAFFEEIVITRQWMADHGGVYVEMRPGDEVNPYLQTIPGLKTVIRDADGKKYMLKNPALATREISEIADRQGSFRFHITSLNPLNPANAPDEFERRALERFARGEPDVSGFETHPEGQVFRYMAPLVTESACLKCHAQQGYTAGDVRGGISVTVPASTILDEIRANKIYLALSVTGVILIIILIVSFISTFFIRDLKTAEQMLLSMAATDPLTGLLNRREGYRRIEAEHARAARSGKPLCAIMLDIDHFKMINDTHGHLTGDDVLKWLAAVLKKTLRTSDILCRYGGEEFLVVVPETTIETARHLAERLREIVEQNEIILNGSIRLRLTISLGVADLKTGESYEHLIFRADQALYAAKNAGRNRVCMD
ncbi:MAG TPA: diguanylate cyclase [Smithellaceae bacterium]|nr:diguanylate cyclase [Smithellaceae bacterium]